MDEKRVIIVGGGAAGLAAAIAAARGGARVLILEAGKRVGQKILKTGNGRCNLTNVLAHPSDYNDPSFVEAVLSLYSPEEILEFFEGIGLLTKEEDEGRVYPLSNVASSVLDVLRDACDRLGVEPQCQKQVIDIHANDDGAYELQCEDGSRIGADSVVICAGGGSNLLGRLGHDLIPFQPVLCPLKTETRFLKGLSGVRVSANVRAFHEGDSSFFFSEQGEVLFRDYGLSGIVIFDLSRFAEVGDEVRLDLLPNSFESDFAAWLTSRYESLCKCNKGDNDGNLSYSELLCGSFHPRVNNAVVRAAGYKPSEKASPESFQSISYTAKNFSLTVLGSGDARQAQVTRGGASVHQFNPQTLESALAPKVFAAGEILDIDGRCGGFNLHWAWASGLAAGAAAALEA